MDAHVSTPKYFPADRSLRNAWRSFKIAFPGYFFVCSGGLLFFAILAHILVTLEPLLLADTALHYMLDAGTFVAETIFEFTLIYLSLRLIHTDKFSFSGIIRAYRSYLPYVGGLILYVGIVLFGSLMFIVPGILWALKYLFFPFVLIDSHSSIRDSFTKSAILTKGIKLPLLGFLILLVITNALAVAAFNIGVFLTFPVSVLAVSWLYRLISEAYTISKPRTGQ